ncbi:hypothetical protein ACAD32_00143 [Clavibacter nebraskensis]|uniref:hypothetical protein n=1 Tax=Clavibacter nebraskensis TaxID=31963 RepID=UPI00059B9252|nr:hypothetical protein VV38_00385 [Clavibacter nebraskensis]OAH18911.1 hypothetical protein A3Q38_10855 [Clavibacter nebraskensis]
MHNQQAKNPRTRAFESLVKCLEDALCGEPAIYATHTFTMQFDESGPLTGTAHAVTETLIATAEVRDNKVIGITVTPLRAITSLEISDKEPTRRFSGDATWGGLSVTATTDRPTSTFNFPAAHRSSASNAEDFARLYPKLVDILRGR